VRHCAVALLLEVALLPALPAAAGQAADAPRVVPQLSAADFAVAAGTGGLFEDTAGQTGDAVTGLGLWRDGTAAATATATAILGGTGYDDQDRVMVDAGAGVCEGGPLMM